MKHLVLLASLLLVASCSMTPSDEELAKADYGTPISQEEAETIVRAWFETNLKDPESARIKFGSITKGWITPDRFSSTRFGYIINVECNAKNSFGGYVGAKLYRFMLKNGTVTLCGEERNGLLFYHRYT